MKEYRKEKRKERKQRARGGGGKPEEDLDIDEGNEEDIDPELAAMMGFSGFGSSKKAKQ